MNAASRTYARSMGLTTAIVSLALTGPAVATTAQAGEQRVTVSKHYHGAKLQRDAPLRESRDEYAGFDTGGQRTGKAPSASQAKTSANGSRTPNTDFWFYDADVELFGDDDRDGYYSGIDLLFDADTYFSAADVYAVVYLSLDGGAWNEYAATDDFAIFGASGDDDYVIVTDLVSGYPTGSYDILIELFDAYDDAFLAYLGPDDTSELAFLPLEDMDRDTPLGGGSTVVINRGGGGALDWIMLLTLGVIALVARRRIIKHRSSDA